MNPFDDGALHIVEYRRLLLLAGARHLEGVIAAGDDVKRRRRGKRCQDRPELGGRAEGVAAALDEEH